MNDDQTKQTPIFEQLRQEAAHAAIRSGEQEFAKLLTDAADRLQAFEDVAQRVSARISAGGITSHDAPSDAALAALRDLAG